MKKMKRAVLEEIKVIKDMITKAQYKINSGNYEEAARLLESASNILFALAKTASRSSTNERINAMLRTAWWYITRAENLLLGVEK